MFKSLEEITIDAPRGRPRTPVRRHSHAAGREGTFWRATSRQNVRQIVLAARRYELATRQPGARNGALGHVALEVLDLLANLVSYKTGRLDPSIETLMRRLKRSRDAIVRALRVLRTNGFLDWIRRYVPTGNEGRGPQVQQTSNAYRLSMPERAKRLLRLWGFIPPAPDDFSHAQELRAAEIEAHRASLSELERTRFDVDEDSPLGAALLRLAQARAVRKERESAGQSESHPSLFSLVK